MNKKQYAKFNIKDKVLKRELARAHGMIVLLVIALMGTLAVASRVDSDTFQPGLTLIVIILLACVGIISLTVVLSIASKKK